MIRLSKVVLVLVLVLSALVAGRGAAQPPPATVEGARALYVEGLALRQRGDLALSLERLRAAHALYATPIITLELGRALGLLTRYDEARAVLATVAELPQKPNESDKARRARAEAAELLAEYERTSAPPPPLPVAPAANDPVPSASPPSAPQAVLPRSEEARVSTVAPEPIAPGPVRAAPRAEPGDARAPTGGPRVDALQRSTRLLFSGLGVAGAGLAVGAATGLTTLIRANHLKARCDGNACPPGSGVERTLRIGVAADVAFAVAGAGVALAIVVVLVQRRALYASAHTAPGLHLTFDPTSGSVTW